MDFIKRNWWWILGGGAVLYLMTKAKSATAAPGAAGAAAVAIAAGQKEVEDLINGQLQARPGTKVLELSFNPDGTVTFAWQSAADVQAGLDPNFYNQRHTWPSLNAAILSLRQENVIT